MPFCSAYWQATRKFPVADAEQMVADWHTMPPELQVMVPALTAGTIAAHHLRVRGGLSNLLLIVAPAEVHDQPHEPHQADDPDCDHQNRLATIFLSRPYWPISRPSGPVFHAITL